MDKKNELNKRYLTLTKAMITLKIKIKHLVHTFPSFNFDTKHLS